MARVLLVDSNEDTCRGIQLALEHGVHGASVVHTAQSPDDGIAAITAARGRGMPYDVVVTELQFRRPWVRTGAGSQGGMRVLKAAQESPPTVPIILTAFPSVVSAYEAIQSGAFRYLTKLSGSDFTEVLASAVAEAADFARGGAVDSAGAPGASHSERRATLSVDAAFAATDQRNLAWLLDRLSKSTAGVRGLIADTPRLTELSLADAERTPQLDPTIVALIAQAYAEYFRTKRDSEISAFVGYDARFLSREFGDLFTSVLSANGVRVYRDHNREPTPTPVTSFMAVLHGLGGGIQITASHNPPNHNGIKSSTGYGGVDTDDISDEIAGFIHGLLENEGQICLGPTPGGLVQPRDAKKEYAEKYLRATFPPSALEPLRQSFGLGCGFLFDGLYGVGGMAMRRYLDVLLAGTDWSHSIQLLNDKPDPSIGGIEKPDPSDPNTLVLSGAIQYLTEHREVLVSVTADMDADRIGTAVIIPGNKVPVARRFGLFTTTFEGGVHAVRFTPNQIFTLIAYDRLLSASGCSPEELRRQVRAKEFPGRRYHLLTTIASSVLAEEMARTYGLTFHLTAVGFKNLGKLAWQIDQKKQGDVILALMEESGGAQIGPFVPWNDRGDTIHRDKDTCALALALFNLAARLKLEDRTILDFYLEMAEQFGSLAYYERLDAYLPNKEIAEDPEKGAEANQAKADMLDRLIALYAPENHGELLTLFGYDASACAAEAAEELVEISLLIKEAGEWKTIHPLAQRYGLPDGGRLEFYRAGPANHDGMRITVYDAEEKVLHWTLVRASGTEALLRVYMEIVEPYEGPDPLRLYRQFEPLLRYLGLNRYPTGAEEDYVAAFEKTVRMKYVPSGS